ncbi:mannose-1-phosphate guanylyltransferase/mannose-6-phosphate isomerase, partial [Escherichia coli]|nr:mannose-1-phosphate guanylyltransferase/mannose-6-phosphate isomerase [Escherichia coli]
CNSVMFVCKASTYLNELKRYAPDIYFACEQSIANSAMDMDFNRVDGKVFSQSPQNSIDYAGMGHTSLSAVIPFDSTWSDIGLWSGKDHVTLLFCTK